MIYFIDHDSNGSRVLLETSFFRLELSGRSRFTGMPLHVRPHANELLASRVGIRKGDALYISDWISPQSLSEPGRMIEFCLC